MKNKIKRKEKAGSCTICLGISLGPTPPYRGQSPLSGEVLLAPEGSHPIRHSRALSSPPRSKARMGISQFRLPVPNLGLLNILVQQHSKRKAVFIWWVLAA